MDNASLIDLFQDGDASAMETLYKFYSKQMMSVVCNYVMDRQAAEDILHDGFLIIFSRISELRDPEKLEYWMATIMKNLSLQYLKEQDVTQILSSDYDIADVPEYDDSITLEELETMIRRLPTGYQKVFRLAVLEHKSHREISKLLGISEGTSGSQLHHARVMIQKMIVEYKLGLGLITIVLLIFLVITFRKGEIDPAKSYITEHNERIGQDIEFDGIVPPQVEDTLIHHKSPSIGNKALSLNKDYGIISCDTISVEEINKSLNNVESIAENNDIHAIDSIGNLTNQIKGSSDYTFKDNQDSFFSGQVNRSLKSDISVRGSVSYAYNKLSRNSESFIPGPSQGQESITINHDIPITLSLAISKRLTNSISVESGIQYTILQTTLSSDLIQQSISTHYVGIPIRLRLALGSSNKFTFSGSSGVMCEFPTKGLVRTHYEFEPSISERYTPPIQMSVMLGTGVEYAITQNLGIFVEPTVNYFFKASSLYPTIRQDRPLEITMPVGIRCKW